MVTVITFDLSHVCRQRGVGMSPGWETLDSWAVLVSVQARLLFSPILSVGPDILSSEAGPEHVAYVRSTCLAAQNLLLPGLWLP